MIKQIKIILDPDQPENKKGDFFENLMRDVFESQRYKIQQRVNFTGMEIDLIAQHRDRDEIAYIECKAKEQLSSKELKAFAFNVNHHKATFGYFLSTSEYTNAEAIAHLLSGMSNTYKKQTTHILFAWAKFIYSSRVKMKHVSSNTN